VLFTRHAEERCSEFRRSRDEVADLVLTNHARRRRNPRAADWLVRAGGLVLAYNWPDRGNSTAARVVTLWRQG
jgi:hypothetical protein